MRCAVRGRLHRPAPRPQGAALPTRHGRERGHGRRAGGGVRDVDQRARHRRGLPLRRGGMEHARVVCRPGDDALLPQARPGPLPQGSRRLLGRRSRTAARRSGRGCRRGRKRLPRREGWRRRGARHGSGRLAGGRRQGAAHRHSHHERDVFRPFAVREPRRHGGTAHALLRTGAGVARMGHRLRVGVRRGDVQQRVRVPHGIEHGKLRRRRVSLRALRPGRQREPGHVLQVPGLRHARHTPGRRRQLAARPRVWPAGLRRVRRHLRVRGRRDAARLHHGPRDVRLRARPRGRGNGTAVRLRRHHTEPWRLRHGARAVRPAGHRARGRRVLCGSGRVCQLPRPVGRRPGVSGRAAARPRRTGSSVFLRRPPAGLRRRLGRGGLRRCGRRCRARRRAGALCGAVPRVGELLGRLRALPCRRPFVLRALRRVVFDVGASTTWAPNW